MDVYDGYDQPIGTIEGSIFTLSPSKFKFYDSTNQLLGVAYMDVNKMSFSIVSNNNEPLAQLIRVFIPEETDYWITTIYNGSEIPLPMLLLFGSFVVDHQEKFRIDD